MDKRFFYEFTFSIIVAGFFYWVGNTSLFLVGLIGAFGGAPGHAIKRYIRRSENSNVKHFQNDKKNQS